MERSRLVCKNCGKLYNACRSLSAVSDTFRWQNVACSPECGSKYFAKVLAARARSANDLEAFALYELEYQDEYDDEIFDEDTEEEEDE